MKIYEIGTGYTPIPAKMGAATEIVAEELSYALLKSGEDVRIIDICAEDRDKIDIEIEEVQIPSFMRKTNVNLGIMHKLKRVVYSLLLAKKIKKILKKTDEKIVLHFHNQYNMFFYLKCVPKKLREKAISAYTVHSYIWGAQWDEIKETVQKRYFQEIYCVKNADAVLVLNNITAEHFEREFGVDKEKIHKILNGVNTEKYSPLSFGKIAELKEGNGFKNKKIIFQVGSVCERKNQLWTVKALCEYLKKNRDVIFIYAGGIIDYEYSQTITAFAAENGIEKQVIYAGELSPGEELNNYYNMADCFVFTSTLESFGLVIVEAISAGVTAIVGSNLMFNLDGGYRMYHSEDEFIEAVDCIITSDESKGSAIADFAKSYDWNSVAQKHIEIFEKTGQ